MTMRSSVLLLLAFAATGAAQTPAPAAQPAGAPVAARDANPSTHDPRVCLEFASRAQVIACAEKYRPRRSAAKSSG